MPLCMYPIPTIGQNMFEFADENRCFWWWWFHWRTRVESSEHDKKGPVEEGKVR